LKFLLDQGLPRSAVAPLRARGHEAEHVGDVGLSAASDVAILDEAERRGSVVVTLDADFHSILALSGRRAPSVIRLRVQNARGAEIAALVLEVVGVASVALAAGAIATSARTMVRVRSLPIR